MVWLLIPVILILISYTRSSVSFLRDIIFDWYKYITIFCCEIKASILFKEDFHKLTPDKDSMGLIGILVDQALLNHHSTLTLSIVTSPVPRV